LTRTRATLLAAATLLVLVAARSDRWPGLRGPAPYPPEWQWGFEPKRVDARALAPVVVLGAGLLGLVALAQRAARARWSRLGLLAGATLLGWAWQLALLGLEPAGAAAELESRTLSGSFTSHFKVAAGVEDAGGLLSRHHELLPGFRRGAPHSATHPPGPILYYLGVQRLVARMPSVAETLGGQTRVAAIGGAALLGLLGAAACFAVAALALALGAGAAASLRAGVLWALVPGPCLMVPELDQALALPVAGAVAMIAAAVTAKAARPFASRAVAAGLLGGGAAFFSYGAPLLVALGAVAAVAPALGTRESRRRAALVVAVTAAVAVACFLLPALLGHHPLGSAATALAIHREQFTARRSYALWLLFNLVDLAVFLGVPVVAFGSWGPRTPFRLAAAAGVLALVASGLIRGEMGRILVPLMPVLLVAGVVWPPSATAPEGEPSAATALVLAALLAVSDVVLRLSWELP
jgi:hypothetical protein